jgi:hypothetical protein
MISRNKLWLFAGCRLSVSFYDNCSKYQERGEIEIAGEAAPGEEQR